MKRFPATATFSEMFARMTNRQKDALIAVERSRQEMARLSTSRDSAQAGLDRAVLDALEAGVPSRVLAEALDVSTSRIYQIRNRVTAEMSQ